MSADVKRCNTEAAAGVKNTSRRFKISRGVSPPSDRTDGLKPDSQPQSLKKNKYTQIKLDI